MLENFFCLILAGLLLIGFLAWRETSQSAWRDFAQQNGLKFSASPFDLNGKVAGEYRGRRLLIDAFLPAGKAHPIIVTRLEIAVRNPNNIRYSYEGLSVSGVETETVEGSTAQCPVEQR